MGWKSIWRLCWQLGGLCPYIYRERQVRLSLCLIYQLWFGNIRWWSMRSQRKRTVQGLEFINRCCGRHSSFLRLRDLISLNTRRRSPLWNDQLVRIFWMGGRRWYATGATGCDSSGGGGASLEDKRTVFRNGIDRRTPWATLWFGSLNADWISDWEACIRGTRTGLCIE